MWDMFMPLIREKANELGPSMRQQQEKLGVGDLVYMISHKLDERDEAPDENGVMVKNLNKGKYQVFLSYMDRTKKTDRPVVYFELTYIKGEDGKPMVSGLEALLTMITGGEGA